MFFFHKEEYSVREGESVEVAVLRLDSSRPSSVRVASSSRSAKEEDYIPINHILCFDINETHKVVRVFAKKDDLVEGDEFFTLQLLAMEPNSIGYPSIATVKIIDMPMPVNPPRIFVDFGNADDRGRIRLNCVRTIEDLAQLKIQLHDGLALIMYGEEIEVPGVVCWSEKENIWVVTLDRHNQNY